MDVTTPLKTIPIPDLLNAPTLIEGAEACYISGLGAAECAPALYQRYKPAALEMSRALLAVWTTTTQSEMTTILTQFYSATEVQNAVTGAYSYYLDVMVRDTLTDVGQIPYPGTDVSSSPDIYPVGTQPLADPDTLLATWNKGPTANIYWNSTSPVTNYIYIRTTNLYPGANPWYPDPETGVLVPNQLYLYYSLASLLLMPSQWSNQMIPTAAGQSPATTTATVQGEHGVAAPVFQWVTNPPPQGDHYCLIARAVTHGHPNPIPRDGTLTNFCNYVRDNPSVAWRNVSVVYIASQPTKASRLSTLAESAALPGTPVNSSLVMTNPEPLPITFTIQVRATNMPDGCTIQLASSDTGMNLGPVEVSANLQNWEVSAELPARYHGMLDVTIVVPNRAVMGALATVSVINYAHALVGTELSRYGHPPATYGMSRETLRLGEGDTMVYVGNFDFQFENGTDPYEPTGDE